MAEQNNTSTPQGNAGASPNDSSAGAPENTIPQLLEEKKILEEKNKKLAELLNICAKNANESAAEGKDGSASPDAAGADVKEELALLKKSVADTGKKLEKSLSAQNSEHWNAVMSEMKKRFASIEEKISAIDGIKPMQKKLDEIEAEVRDKRRHGGNPFGKIGVIGGAEAAPETDDADDNIVKKLEEFEQKIDRLGNRIGARNETESRGSGLVQRLGSMIPKKMKAGVERITSRFSHDESPLTHAAGNGAAAATVHAGGAAKAESEFPQPISGVSFKPVDDKVSEEVLESLILDNIDESRGKMRIKVHELSDFSDASKIQNDILSGDLILVNIRPLRQNDMELLRKIVDQLKKTCAAVNGNIAGVGDSYLVIMPRNVQMHKE